jgi:hypothetical protein
MDYSFSEPVENNKPTFNFNYNDSNPYADMNFKIQEPEFIQHDSVGLPYVPEQYLRDTSGHEINELLVSNIVNLNENFKQKQLNFLRSLTEREINVLNLYTREAYVIVNEILRGNVQDVKKYNSRFFENVKTVMSQYVDRARKGGVVKEITKILDTDGIGLIKQFVNEFMNLTKRFPTLDEDMVVFRGVNRKEDILTHGNEILSTALNPGPASRFIKSQKTNCCFLKLVLKKGVKCLWIQPISSVPSEFEVIVVPPFTISNVTEKGLDMIGTINYEANVQPINYKRGGKRTYRKNNNKRKATKKNRNRK